MCGAYVEISDETGVWAYYVRFQDIPRGEWRKLEQSERIIKAFHGSGRSPSPIFDDDYRLIEQADREKEAGTLPHFLPRYNIRPTDTAPIIVNPDGNRRVVLGQFGLIPSWWKQPKPPSKYFNARAERLTSAGRDASGRPTMWEPLVGTQRCIVVTSGFYEWPEKGRGKAPVYVHRNDTPFVSMAGLFNVWDDRASGRQVMSFAIVTSESNSFMKPIHDRMPVVLPDREAEALWLDPASDNPSEIIHLVEPLEWDGFSYHRVKPLTQDGDNMKMLEPVADGGEPLLDQTPKQQQSAPRLFD
jgi:putative SOS response-associated peptidase YedK